MPGSARRCQSRNAMHAIVRGPPNSYFGGPFLICSSGSLRPRGRHAAGEPLTRVETMGRHARLAALGAVDRPDLVLADLGCGDGRTVRALLALAPPPRLVHALDHSAELSDDLLHDERVRSRIVDLDDDLPFASESLDRVVSMNVVEALV